MPRARLSPPIGEKFGTLTVIGVGEPRGQLRHTTWLCRCDCGTEEKEIQASSLRNGRTLSCGCQQGWGGTHGYAKAGERHPLYETWVQMRRRCRDAKAPNYPRYGGRGIAVCERWQDFENFLADMGERPDGHTLDRVDNEANYEPSNCRWATPSEQARNRRKPNRELVEA